MAKRYPPILSLLFNIALLYLLYMLCRIVYVLEFWDVYGATFSRLSVGQLLIGSLRFDTAAICYTNVPYALLVLFPLSVRIKESKPYRIIAKTLYVVVNAVMLSANLVDTVYSRYTGRRTTWTIFSEFSAEGNLGSIFFVEVLHHWYLVLLGLAFIAALIFLYCPYKDVKIDKSELKKREPSFRISYSILQSTTILFFLLVVPLSIAGIRGGFSRSVRPIAISNANQYVDQPSQAAIVLNTPFSLIRTCGKTTFSDPHYFSQEELSCRYSPIHQSSPISVAQGANIVVLIVESFGTEYWGYFNDYPGYTPFLDSLASVSLTFQQSYANGRKSIDGMPSILSSIPMFVEPFFVTNYSLNDVSGLAGELSREGYSSAFFHGADNGSMGFQAFARTTGFQHYYGRTEYESDPTTRGVNDFDGTWAIWDEEFMQYFAHQLDTMHQPFVSALFTASSHHPFVVPERYRQSLHQPGHPMYTCVRYTDQALRRFFDTASRMPWFKNTIFVITADHTNHSEQPAYSTPLGSFRVPILFFDPSGRLPRGMSNAVAQQIDIMPTLLSAVGYPNPYVAFGQDLLTTPADSTWAVQYNSGMYQLVQDNTLVQYDGEKVVGVYHLANDPQCRNNLTSSTTPTQLARLQAIVQSYMQRMIGNELVVH
ncbi:MAG: sulfatase-like hydrolase/transferase [Bacteroidales bacterium]|nr:sulfatase-like hydrolase/transferase [Bacteroidales bacterium]